MYIYICACIKFLFFFAFLGLCEYKRFQLGKVLDTSRATKDIICATPCVDKSQSKLVDNI